MKTLRPKQRLASVTKRVVAHLLSFSEFFFLYYLKRKILAFSYTFEKNKNRLVKFLLMKRGRYNRPFLHLTTMGVLGVGVLVGPYLADTYPILTQQARANTDLANAENQEQSVSINENVFSTDRSEKPRDKVITYTVQNGDTLSTIAKKFQISTETIKWANDLSSDSISVGDELDILPVSGMQHKVQKGDTVYTIAKKYDTEAQKIVDFPFNEFANTETFALVEGQMVVVPDGIKPSEQPTYIKRETYIAKGPTNITASGFTWPLSGGISQGPSWYHMALDITSSLGAPIVAAHNGTVSIVNLGTWDGGYGNNIYVDGPDGYQSHYAHMSTVNVSAGDTVVAGRTVIGYVGMTGRTTGPHLHFEIRKNGALMNPMSFLR